MGKMSVEERNALNHRIENINYYSESNQEKIRLEVLKLMDGYIRGFAKSYSSKCRRISFQDFVAEGQLAVLKHMKDFKSSKGKQVETYLYYWINDAMQVMYANMCGPISYSRSIYRKTIKAGETVPSSVSLNNIASDDGRDTEFSEVLTSTNKSPLDIMVEKSNRETFKDTIVKKFGEDEFNAFYNKFVNNKTIKPKYEGVVTGIVEFIKNSNQLTDILYSLARGSSD